MDAVSAAVRGVVPASMLPRDNAYVVLVVTRRFRNAESGVRFSPWAYGKEQEEG